jgi:hypothetical protein
VIGVHVRTREEAGDGSFADLGVDLAVVLVLAPGLCRFVEDRKREIGHILQHGDEPALDRAPERLLLGILVNMFCKTYLPVCGAARYVAQSDSSAVLGGTDVFCAIGGCEFQAPQKCLRLINV